jgi:flagellar biogenesis protein FliO
MDLNNITVDSLKEKFAAFDRKTLTKFGIGIGAIILFLIIYFMILKPMVDERKAKYADKTLKIQEIKQFENDIVSIKSQIKKLNQLLKKIQRYFTQKLKLRGCTIVLADLHQDIVWLFQKLQKRKPCLYLSQALQNRQKIY